VAACEVQAIGQADLVGRLSELGGDGGGKVGLVVQPASHPRDQSLRHELADEDDAALLAVADVEAKVQLGEVPVAGPTIPRTRVRRNWKATRLTKALPSRRSSARPGGNRFCSMAGGTG